MSNSQNGTAVLFLTLISYDGASNGNLTLCVRGCIVYYYTRIVRITFFSFKINHCNYNNDL